MPDPVLTAYGAAARLCLRRELRDSGYADELWAMIWRWETAGYLLPRWRHSEPGTSFDAMGQTGTTARVYYADHAGQTRPAPRLGAQARTGEARATDQGTRRAAARKAGTSKAHVIRLLSGTYAGISTRSLAKLAAALGCEIEVQVRPVRPARAAARPRPNTHSAAHADEASARARLP